MEKNEIIKFDNLDIEVLTTEQELLNLYGGVNSKKGIIRSILDILSEINSLNCKCQIGNNCNCGKK